MSRLPNAPLCLVETAKVRDYLLDPHNAHNRGKADQFGQYGFTRTDWSTLAGALRAHPLFNDVIATTTTIHSVEHVVRCHLRSPDRRNPCLTSVWIIEPGAIRPRLVTAY